MRPLLLCVLIALKLHASEVRVFAAASLSEAIGEIGRRYEAQTGERVIVNFGSSGMLARQIAAGAPADVFLSADERRVDRIDPATRVTLLSNTLVVVVNARDGRSIKSLAGLTTLRSLALGDPDSVPAGAYARSLLEKAGLWGRLAPKVIPTANVRAALAAVASGNADAAIVYRTDALVSGEVTIALEIPGAAGPRILYPFGVVRDAENRAGAIRFMNFLQSETALQIFARYGFLVTRQR